jgi:hypothetical protein
MIWEFGEQLALQDRYLIVKDDIVCYIYQI